MNLIASKIKELLLALNQVDTQTDKNGRRQFYCHCPVCGIKKVRHVKSNQSGKKKA